MAPDAGPQTFGGRLARTARGLPDKAAVIEEDSTIRYAELDAAATSIAGRLRTLAPEKPGFVCLLFQSKIAAIKAVFGASRSSSAYVMLDAGDPDARLQFIARDCAPFVALTEAELIDKAAALAPSGCPVLATDCLEPGGEEREWIRRGSGCSMRARSSGSRPP